MDIASILTDILVVLVAAKLAAEVADRIGIPAVVGEIVAGIIIGPSVLGIVGTDEVLRVLGELGVILLLLQVGLEMDLVELGKVGRPSLSRWFNVRDVEKPSAPASAAAFAISAIRAISSGVAGSRLAPRSPIT